MRVLLSHSTSEKDDIHALRRALEDRGVSVTLGDGSTKTRDAIRKSMAFVLLLSPKSIGSDWVQREIQWALEESAGRRDFRLVVLLRGMETGVLKLLFGAAEALCLHTSPEGLWIENAAREILKALGLAGMDDPRPLAPEPVPPMAELILDFSQPKLVNVDDKPRAAGILRLRYTPPAGRGIDGVPTEFTSPLGPKELEELRWYIESYCDWPWGPFKGMGKAIEAKLPQWGKVLFDAIVTKQEKPMRAFIEAQGASGDRLEKRITVNVEYRNASVEGAMAAALLFGLPWELLHDEYSYLFDGAAAIRVRRTLPSENEQPPIEPRDRVRVLLVRARPEDDGAEFMDPRSSALPLAEVLHDLGEQVNLDVLHDGTFKALSDALTKADDNNEPYQIVHFDGHGIYDKSEGVGKLCFEDAEDADKCLEKRQSQKVSAKDLGGLLRARRVPLFVLDACQTGMAEKNVDTSVAAELLRQGVASVVAMRYSVLVGTARRFVRSFYESLAQGHRIGRAMLDAQRALKGNAVRADYGSLGRLELQDWMVPVLFQENEDSQIFVRGIDRHPAADEDRKRMNAIRRGELPEAPKHGFVGRARELLSIERRLVRKRRVAIVGAGGEGKTVLAVEAANWFLLTQQRERVAFVSVERLSDARAVLDAIGRQLVNGYSVATAEAGGNDPKLPVKSALMQRKTLLIVDNFESLLALAGKDPTNDEAVREIVKLVHELADIGQTWLMTTSRESLPAPLDGREWRVPSLSTPDGRELLVSVLRQHHFDPPQDRKAAEAMETLRDELIEAVRGHARSLVLLGPTIVGQGLEPTRDAIRKAMIELEKQYPDDRERSLLASVRVSLARLDEATRRKIAPLCVFRQAVPLMIMPPFLEVEPHEAVALGERLVELGLASLDGPYLIPDPALGEALGVEIDACTRATAETRWREGMQTFAGFLYQQQFQETQIARKGTNVALIDLLEALSATVREVQTGAASVNEAIEYATALEPLISFTGHFRALRQLRALRTLLTKNLRVWSHARFNAESEEVDRYLEAGNIPSALELATRLRDHADAAGDTYAEAAYDRAIARLRLGRVLRIAGNGEDSLCTLEEAQTLFMQLAETANADMARFESMAITEQADTLRHLGQLAVAATKYEESIQRDEKRGDVRGAAVGRANLGNVLFLEGRLPEALKAWVRACDEFEILSEPASVSTAWHQIGVIHEQARQFDAAERGYKRSLEISVRLGNRAEEAKTLGQLGSLYRNQGRWEDAASLYRRCIATLEVLGNAAGVSRHQHNLGITLHKLGQHDQARDLLTAALTATMQRGYSGQPWKILADVAELERDAGQVVAAATARNAAMKVYRAYRMAGGEAIGPTRIVVIVGQLLEEHGPDTMATLWRHIRPGTSPDPLPQGRIFVLRALDAIFAGNRDPQLATDPNLDPDDAVELQLLLESLRAPE